MSRRRVLFACDLDSQVFGALPLALSFAARGWQVTFAIETSRTLPQEVLEKLVGQFRLIERAINTLPTDDEAFHQDAIGVFVTGSRLAVFRHTIEIASRVRSEPRPALFCGFNGLVFEKFEEGVAWRLGYDVIGLNGPRDQDAFVDFLHATEFADQPSVVVGLRRKTDQPQRPLKVAATTVTAETSTTLHPEAISSAPPPPEDVDAPMPAGGGASSEISGDDPGVSDGPTDFATTPDLATEGLATEGLATEGLATEDSVTEDSVTEDSPTENPATEDPATAGEGVPIVAPAKPTKLFVFAEQVVVPRNLRERQNLVATLARLAAASPDWTVALKARVRPGEQTFHSQPNHIEGLVKAVKTRPANLIVTYEPLDSLLERADLFATISSTALFDAFDYGVPSLVATDFGLRNADGAHVFFASGLLVRLCDLASLDDAPIRSPDERWINRMGYGDPYSPEALIDWLETFDHSRPMPNAFVSFPAAMSVAAGSAATATAPLDAWETLERAIESGGAETRSALATGWALSSRGPNVTPLAALRLLGFALTKSLAPASAKSGSVAKTAPSAPAKKAAGRRVASPERERFEGPITAYSRRLGVYWIIKRTRLRLGLPIHARREA